MTRPRVGAPAVGYPPEPPAPIMVLVGVRAGIIVIAASVLAVGGPALAEPGEEIERLGSDVAMAQELLADARDAESIAVEAANRASDDLSRASGRAISARRKADAAAEELRVARRSVASRAVAVYKSGGLARELAVILQSATPAQLLVRLRYLRDLGHRDRARVERAQVAERDSAVLEELAQEAVREEIALTGRRDEELLRARRSVEGQAELLRQLDQRYRSAVLAEEARRRAAEEAAARAYLGEVPQVRVSHGGLQRAIDTALAQVGTPYVWGGESPGGFDCSGLVRYAFLEAGVELLHRADLQYLAGPHPARAELAPGDLVFFSSDGTAEGIHHNGIYLGNGLMVVAPHTGAFVRVQPMERPDYFGATRLLA